MKKDDELRRKLAETFEDFEAEPQAQTWENIRAAIQPRRKRRPLWLFFWLGWGCLLIGAGVFSVRVQSVAVTRAIPSVSTTEIMTQKTLEQADNAAISEEKASQSPDPSVAVAAPLRFDTTASQVAAHLFFATIKPRTPVSRSMANPDKMPVTGSLHPESGLDTPLLRSVASGLPMFVPEKEIAIRQPTNPPFDSAQVTTYHAH